ncbi:MAG TPA: hypothetical protein PLV56_01825 [Synergistales bacterium]|nr:hypothetical protein [Synergistales bacterium]
MKRIFSVKRLIPGMRELAFLVTLLVLLFLFFPFSRAHSADLDDLLQERTSTLWIEGQVIGDMILGSRAQLAIIYVDSRLVKAVSGNHQAPEWLKWNVQYFSTLKKGSCLFILRYKTFKPWDFQPGLVHVDGVAIERSNIKTREAFLLEGELPSDTTGTCAVEISLSGLKPGKTLSVGYDEFETQWKVPR